MIVLSAVAVAPASASAAAPVIYRYAGTGIAGAATAGTATSSRLKYPWGVAVDSAGDVFIADTSNHEVEKVTPAGTLSIVAGTGTSGTPTSGAQATSTPLRGPKAVAVDSSGDLYIADPGNYSVYEVSPSGTLSVVAGTGFQGTPIPGTAAATSSLGAPNALAVNSSGDLYISDGDNAQIYEVNPAGIISVVAGNGNSGPTTAGQATNVSLGVPTGVATDAAGNVYIADNGNGEVDKVAPDGTLSVISNTPSLDTTGVAVDGAGDVFIAEGEDCQIHEIPAGGSEAIYAGVSGTCGAPSYGTAATTSPLNTVTGVAVTPAGRLFIAEQTYSTIDLVTPPAPVSTTAPTQTGAAVVGQTLSVNEGSWANDPVLYAYQWQDCDSTGANCTNITGATARSYTLTSSDQGHTVQAVVTASNGGGSASAASTPSADVTTPITSTTPTTTTPTTTTTTTSTPVEQIDPTISGTPAIGQTLQASVGGWTGSDLTYQFQWLRDGVAIPGATAATYQVTSADAGHKLSVQVIASDGTTSITAASQTVLALTTDARGCSSPSGRLTASAIGSVRLGMKRAAARRLVASTQPLNSYTDNLCLAGGYGIRVGYANPTMLGHGKLRGALRYGIVFATTANPYYTLGGARPGMTVASVAKRLHLARPMVIGPNTWYVIPGTTTNHVLKTRDGVIQEIGDLNRALTRTRDQQGRLLRLF